MAVPPRTDPSAAADSTSPPGEEDEAVVGAERLVAGGVALCRHDDGRIVLVEGAFPGERVRIRSGGRRRGAERGVVVQVVESSPGRRPPHCAHVEDGCGGCDLGRLAVAEQRQAKVEMVRDALRRLGRVVDPVVELGPELSAEGFRTTLRLAVVGGRAGLRAHHSHEVVALDHCVVADPLLDELVRAGRFGSAEEVTLRVGGTTGECLALVHPRVDDVHLPDDVVVVGADEVAQGRRAWIHDEVAGRRWRISATSFFQTRPDGAAALVEVVARLAGDVLAAPDLRGDGAPTLLDAYCGVGLFSGSLLDPTAPHGLGRHLGWRAVAVERQRSSVADARHNLAGLPVKVVASSVERFRPPRAQVVVADPARAGLGRRGAEVLTATGARRIVLVSCDVAAAGRDAALLAEGGYRLERAVVVDLFPHTHHAEVVASFGRLQQ